MYFQWKVSLTYKYGVCFSDIQLEEPVWLERHQHHQEEEQRSNLEADGRSSSHDNAIKSVPSFVRKNNKV